MVCSPDPTTRPHAKSQDLTRPSIFKFRLLIGFVVGVRLKNRLCTMCDIAGLTDDFGETRAVSYGLSCKTVAPQIVEALEWYEWHKL
jgi:hypothetical protein